jgi:hypothetical protein
MKNIAELAVMLEQEAVGACESFVLDPAPHRDVSAAICDRCGWTERRHLMRQAAAALRAWPVFPPAPVSALTERHSRMLALLADAPELRHALSETSVTIADLCAHFLTEHRATLEPVIDTPLAGDLTIALVVGWALGFGLPYQDERSREAAIDVVLEAARVGADRSSRIAADIALREVH